VHVDALVHGTGFVQVWCMVDVLVHCTCFVQVSAWLMHLFMVQADYRLFGQVIVTGYLYRFGAWLIHLFMVQVEVHVDVW
jgi:hypothetical protein